MIGVDIVSIERIKHFKERFGDKALAKFLTLEEIALVKSDASLAGFFAATAAPTQCGRRCGQSLRRQSWCGLGRGRPAAAATHRLSSRPPRRRGAARAAGRKHRFGRSG